MKANNIEIHPPSDLDTIEFTLTVKRNHQNLQKLNKANEIVAKDKLLEVGIKQYRQRRSLNANSYCFILCDKIANKIGNTKEFVYKKAIRQVGQFEILPIRDDALSRWKEAWESKGLGWQSEIMRDSKIEGYTNTINYFGSSVYDTKQMSLLLEEIVYQAKELGIETMTEEEKQSLMERWEENNV